jgi:hypothetical protein
MRGDRPSISAGGRRVPRSGYVAAYRRAIEALPWIRSYANRSDRRYVPRPLPRTVRRDRDDSTRVRSSIGRGRRRRKGPVVPDRTPCKPARRLLWYGPSGSQAPAQRNYRHHWPKRPSRAGQAITGHRPPATHHSVDACHIDRLSHRSCPESTSIAASTTILIGINDCSVGDHHPLRNHCPEGFSQHNKPSDVAFFWTDGGGSIITPAWGWLTPPVSKPPRYPEA